MKVIVLAPEARTVGSSCFLPHLYFLHFFHQLQERGHGGLFMPTKLHLGSLRLWSAPAPSALPCVPAAPWALLASVSQPPAGLGHPDSGPPTCTQTHDLLGLAASGSLSLPAGSLWASHLPLPSSPTDGRGFSSRSSLPLPWGWRSSVASHSPSLPLQSPAVQAQQHPGSPFNFCFCVFCIVGFCFSIFSIIKSTCAHYGEFGRYECNEKNKSS